MQYYIDFVNNYTLLSAFIQFALLGTIGEIISYPLRKQSLRKMGNALEIILKIIAWGILGIIIKYGFTGMKGFTDTLMIKGFIPFFRHSTFGWALIMSAFTNIFFGPQMMLFHRVEENLIMRKWTLHGMKQAWFTLIWFWIPAHTITFMLPADFQIGLAALWSVVLGIILGLSKR